MKVARGLALEGERADYPAPNGGVAMRFKQCVCAAGLVAIGFALATAAPAASFGSAKGEFSGSRFSDLTYSPKRACARPFFSKSLKEGVDELLVDTYKSMARDYLDCMKRAAEADIGYARDVIQEGYKKDAADFIAEIERGY